MFRVMRTLLAIAAATALTAATANAQYKTPPPPPAAQPGAVQITPNNNIQISTPTAAPEDELTKARRIPRDEAMSLVKQKKAVYIDVRSKDQFDDGHIPGAINIPLTDLQNRFKDLPPRKFLITYCA
jgi:Spy/CpxP family protein refolding chaperone